MYPFHICFASEETLALREIEIPKAPPMFCMLLRKHLSSGKITDISQIDYERIIRFGIESYNELGDLTTKYLTVELMGRNSNIILTDSNMRIIDSARHIDFTQSTFRQILPGADYILPPPQNKIPFLSDAIKNATLDFSKEGVLVEKVILDSVSGISPLTAREIVYRAIGSCNIMCGETDKTMQEKITAKVRKGAFEYSPCMLTDSKTGKLLDFSAVLITQYSDMSDCICYRSVSSLLEDFYKKRDSDERMKQKSADLTKLLHTHAERLVKKSIIQKKELSDAAKKDSYKIKGDLITANIYKIEQGAQSVVLENYYSPENESVTIALKPELTASQNAQRYYKLYNKAKTAEHEVANQLKNTEADLEYINSTLALVENCQSEADLNLIRAELSEQGFLKQRSVKKKTYSESSPLHFVSSDGFDIYVGKNNTQNDYLTLKFANKRDLWFHTKKIHGSHTIIKLGTNKDVPERTIKEAAAVAAYYSKARESSNVPVDYTFISNVKKPGGAKPGFVIYDAYKTVYVNPSLLTKV